MALPEIVIGSKLDAKGFKQAETAMDKLGKSVKNLAQTLGLAFSAVAIVNFGKSAVKAALDAQAQQQRLAALLKVTTGATLDQVNVLNEQAAALEKIGVVTGGNITQVQSQLATFDLQIATIKTLTPAILDYVTAEKGASASTEEFKSMTNGLAQALQGNFASLTKTGFVLDAATKNIIANGTEAERAAALVQVLNSTYKDFNKNLRNTPAGQFQLLADSAQKAKVIIGTDLVAAMQRVAGPDGIGGAADAMEKFAIQIGNAAYGIGVLEAKLKGLPGGGYIGKLLNASIEYSPFGLLSKFGASQKPKAGQASPGGAGATAARIKYEKEQAKLLKDKNNLSKIDNANTLRKLVLTGDEKALAELGLKFDIERINLYAALNRSTDDETRMRLLSLIAIHDSNSALAGMISEANKTTDAFKTLKDGMLESLRLIMEKVKALQLRILAGAGGAPTTQLGNPAPGNPDYIPGVGNPGGPRRNIRPGIPDFNYGSLPSSNSSGVNITINNAGSVITERDLVSSITQGIYNNQASGIPINYSTAY